MAQPQNFEVFKKMIKIAMLTLALLSSQTSMAVASLFETTDCRSVNVDVHSCGHDSRGYFAVTDEGTERIEIQNVSTAVKVIDELDTVLMIATPFFQITRLSDGQLKMDVFFKVRGRN